MQSTSSLVVGFHIAFMSTASFLSVNDNEFLGGMGNRTAKFEVQTDGKVKVRLQFITALKKEYKEYKEYNLEGIKTFKYK